MDDVRIDGRLVLGSEILFDMSELKVFVRQEWIQTLFLVWKEEF